MNGEQISRHSQRRAWRGLPAAGVAVIAAMAVLVGVGRLALASPAAEFAAAAPSHSRVQYTDIGTDNFEATTINWTLTGVPNGPRWNHVNASSPWQKAHSGVKSIWFGDPATGEFGGIGCDTCPVYSGTATFNSPIVIPNNDTKAYLRFWSYERTEMSIPGLECYQRSTCAFDLRQVLISGTLSPGWVVKWDSHFNPTIENVWHSKLIDISEFRGQNIRVQFKFNTGDGRNNDGAGVKPAGWFIDDVNFFTFSPSSFTFLPLIQKNR